MIITHLGDNYFKLQSGEFIILIDPNNQRSFKGATLILNTLYPALTDRPSDLRDPFWIEYEGEYEVKGIRIQGFSTGYNSQLKKEGTAYVIDFEDIKITVLGHLTTDLDHSLYEHFAQSDILILPGGGTHFIPVSASATIIRQLEPKVIIPTFLDDIHAFAKEFDITQPELQDKFVFKKKDLISSSLKVIFLRF